MFDSDARGASEERGDAIPPCGPTPVNYLAPPGLAAPPAPADEVAELLVMFSCIERAISRLTRLEAALLGDCAGGFFAGFNECLEAAHYRAARALIDRPGYFNEFQARDPGSPLPRLEGYRHLLGRFDLERRLGASCAELTFDQLRRMLGVQ
ncbi:MAG: hypothetical protein QOH47_977 [Sphingomonadales bacterium]|jgi:hypothetical protein|nr:hypothetical protein [Sphingomonadales bacterium]